MKLNDEVIKAIINIAKPYQEIEKVVLFGSRAKGTNKPNSDYDIAVFTHSNEFQDKLNFLSQIDELDTIYKIDIVIVDQNTTALLLNNINNYGITLLERGNKMSNFIKAVEALNEVLAEYEKERQRDPALSRIQIKIYHNAVIQCFEFSVELGWKACNEYLEEALGYADISGPRPVMKEAFQAGLVGEDWGDILSDRNLTSHIYNDYISHEIFGRIRNQHVSSLNQLAGKFKKILTQ